MYIGDWVIGQQRLIKDLKQSSPPPRYMPLREHLLNYDTNWTPSDDYIKLYTDSLEQKPYRIRTNSEGFIIGPDDLGRDHEKLDIIFYGGSTTECGFVDENIRFPYLVRKILKYSEGEHNIRTLNAGVSGMNSMHTVLSVIGKGIPQKPSYILFMHAINDLSLLTKTYSYWNAPLEKELVHNSILDGNKLILKYFPNLWLTLNALIIKPNKNSSLRNIKKLV